MCKISKEIKFCTCNSSTLLDSVNYWIIYRRKKGWKIGETVFNENIFKLKDIELKKIENKLNSTNMFDFNYEPKDDDKLYINLFYQGKNNSFTFKFLKSKWEIYNDTLEWMEAIDKLKHQYLIEYRGIIENVFE